MGPLDPALPQPGEPGLRRLLASSVPPVQWLRRVRAAQEALLLLREMLSWQAEDEDTRELSASAAAARLPQEAPRSRLLCLEVPTCPGRPIPLCPLHACGTLPYAGRAPMQDLASEAPSGAAGGQRRSLQHRMELAAGRLALWSELPPELLAPASPHALLAAGGPPALTLAPWAARLVRQGPWTERGGIGRAAVASVAGVEAALRSVRRRWDQYRQMAQQQVAQRRAAGTATL